VRLRASLERFRHKFYFLCSAQVNLDENIPIYALGFAGQSLFGARLIVQLIKSERAGKVLSPVVFWQLSLAGSFLFLIYGIFRNDLVIIGGQFISYYIYIRNLQLKKAWTYKAWQKAVLWLLPPIALTAMLRGRPDFDDALNSQYLLHPLMVMGIVGQLALNLRFLYQWYYSELKDESLLPVGFWHISTWASVLVIVYSVHNPVTGQADPVLFVSQVCGIVVYARNLVLAYYPKRPKQSKHAVQ
jgi:lipid-A-disaccharide synthase-like uncharacterized protein